MQTTIIDFEDLSFIVFAFLISRRRSITAGCALPSGTIPTTPFPARSVSASTRISPGRSLFRMKHKWLTELLLFLGLLLLLAAVLLLRYQSPAAASPAASEIRPEPETALGQSTDEETAVSVPALALSSVPASEPAAANMPQSASGRIPGGSAGGRNLASV